jgi:hypothetical protein
MKLSLGLQRLGGGCPDGEPNTGEPQADQNSATALRGEPWAPLPAVGAHVATRYEGVELVLGVGM